MNSPEQQWWSLRAGEYVLGTLRGSDLALFEKILRHDSAIQHEVDRWSGSLAGLHETSVRVRPPDDVWLGVIERVRHMGVSVPAQAPSAGLSVAAVSQEISRWEGVTGRAVLHPAHASRLLWPGIAAVSAAASLLLATLLSQQRADVLARSSASASPATPSPTVAQGSFQPTAVSVVVNEAGDALWLVEADSATGRVRVSGLAPPAIEAGRDYQLWQVLSDERGVNPLGVLPEAAGVAVRLQPRHLATEVDAFAVSVEPPGGSLDAGPSGPVLYQGAIVTVER